MPKPTKQPADQPPRLRDRAKTRSAILDAARLLFTQRGYEGVSVREIAAAVGVNAALVIRYFGSKELLFAEAITEKFTWGALLDGPRGDFGLRLAHYILTKDKEADKLDPMLAILLSVADERVAALLRTSLDEQFVQPLATWLGGAEAHTRATLITGYILGLSVMRTLVRSAALTRQDKDEVIDRVAKTLQWYVDG